jgi:hypothetical protein
MRTKWTVSTGDRFGRLEVTELIAVRRAGKSRRAAACKCDCGAKVVVLLQGLYRPEGTRSCGCMKRKGTMSARFAETRATPERLHNRSHGLTNHPSYHRWFNMIERCENPSHRAYTNYGGRGISVFAEWRDLATFLTYLDAVLGPCPDGRSLDRVNNDGPYEPGNIRWATRSEQARNQRRRRASC